MRRVLSLSLVMIALAAALIGWNASRFVGAKPQPRMKDLDFLPAPVVAQGLALGHANTVAKLRWIDSFSYFQFQLDRKNDRVAGDGRSGFTRLYETLIALDPHFQPFYEHAALNVSGMLGRHSEALGFLEMGLLHLPHSSELWRNVAATLRVYFKWDEQQAEAFHQFLTAWAGAESDDNGKLAVWQWQKMMDSQRFKDLEQLPYWFDRLRSTKSGSPMGDYIESVIREQLTDYGLRELNALMSDWRAQHSGRPPGFAALAMELGKATTLSEALAAFRHPAPPERLEQVVRLDLLKARHPRELPAFGPIRLKDGVPYLLGDPYGMAWEIRGNAVVSPGRERLRFEDRDLFRANQIITDRATKDGAWPKDLADARTWVPDLSNPPTGGTLRFDGKQIQVDWSKPPFQPWPLR